MEVRARIRQEESGRWVAQTDGQPPVRGAGTSLDRCVAALRRSLDRTAEDGPLTLIVGPVPALAGVAEAARIMGWDKRRVITYIDRGRFPSPIQSLASGRVWLRADVERFADEWRARQARRARRG